MTGGLVVGGGAPAVSLWGRRYPVVLPNLRDARVHLAAVIVSLQVLGQTALEFRLSIAQILVSLVTCAVLESGIAFWRRGVIMWPASALLTGNGTAFILRVPGTEHGDWWSLRGWWIFAATAAVGLLSKYVIRYRGRHIFNPSNIGLVLCLLILGARRAEPLDFWWGPMSPPLALALAIILTGGLTILGRLRILSIAVAFWIAFATGIGVLAASGHSMTARWHLGPIEDWAFWWVLVTSPEIYVFLFFMITDPRTIPEGRVARVIYAVAVGLVSALLIAPLTTELATKIAVLGALAVVCAARPFLERVLPAANSPDDRLDRWFIRIVQGGVPSRQRRATGLAGTVAVIAVLCGAIAIAGSPARTSAVPVDASGAPPLTADEIRSLPEVTVLTNDDIRTVVSLEAARQMARDLVTDLRVQANALREADAELAAEVAHGEWLGQLRERIRDAGSAASLVIPLYEVHRVTVELVASGGQSGPGIIATVAGSLQEQTYAGSPRTLQAMSRPEPVEQRFEIALVGDRYLIVASHDPRRGVDVGPSVPAEGRVDIEITLDRDAPVPQGRVVVVSLVVSNAAPQLVETDVELSVSDGVGDPVPFFAETMRIGATTEKSRTAALSVSQWFAEPGPYEITATADDRTIGDPVRLDVGPADVTAPTFDDVTAAVGLDTTIPAGECGQFSSGAAWGDIDGDGDLDLFVTRLGEPAELFVNDGHGRFGEGAEGRRAAVEGANGASFADYDNDGDADLYVARDGPDVLLANDGSGHFDDITRAAGIADDHRGMSASWADYDGDGNLDLYVTNYITCTGEWETASDIIDEVDYHPDNLYRNDGDGTFTDVTELLEKDPTTTDDGATTGAGFNAAWLDYDGDEDADLYLANDFIGPTPDHNRLWRNDGADGSGGWTFTDVSDTSGTGLFMNTMGIGVGDFDRDLDYDLALSNIGANHLLRNDGAGGFLDETGFGVERPSQRAGERSITWGLGFSDLDLDGWEDLYVAAGNIGRHEDNPAQPNAVFVNDGRGSFVDVSALSGADDPDDSKGVAFADYDRDGDIDVFVVNQGGAPRLYRNTTTTTGRHWLEVATTGVESNRDGCGARIELELDDGTTMVRQVSCGSTSVGSGSQRAVHFGLGTSELIARLEVRWPSGARQVVRNVRADQLIEIVEPA